MAKLKIMTFNLRVDTPNDGINCFSGGRCERVREVIMKEKPDIIGFQEATDAMTEWLAGKIKSKYEIDYIFTDAKRAQDAYIIPDDAPGGIYISDHYAVCAAVSI